MIHEATIDYSKKPLAEMQAVRRWLITLVIMVVLLLGAAGGVAAFLVTRT
jgi:hypothetical protein